MLHTLGPVELLRLGRGERHSTLAVDVAVGIVGAECTVEQDAVLDDAFASGWSGECASA